MRTPFLTVAIALGSAWAIGCGADATEPTAHSAEHLDRSCIDSIDSPVGSAEWQADLDACIDETMSEAEGGSTRSCSTSIQCMNGVCRCGAGPKENETCDGSKTKGASSCSVLCSSCKSSSDGAPPAPVPAGGAPPAPAPSGGAPAPSDGAPAPSGGGSCRTGVQCNNGACICTGGAAAGESCDGAKTTGPTACQILCRSCD